MEIYFPFLLILWLGESRLSMTISIVAKNMSGQNVPASDVSPERFTDTTS